MNELMKTIPLSKFFIEYDYEKNMLEKNCVSKIYNLGTLYIREGLPLDRAFIASTNRENTNILTQEDVYVVFKLLKFSKKLKLIEKLIASPNLGLLISSIVTDLVDEF